MFKSIRTTSQERVFWGILGALFLSMLGAAVLPILWNNLMGATLGGILSAFGAVYGYEKFGEKLTVKGLVISIVISVIVLIAAWHIGLSLDVYRVYKEFYASGDVNFEITFGQALANPYEFFDIFAATGRYITILLYSVYICLFASGCLVVEFRNEMKKIKLIAKEQVQMNSNEAQITDD